MNFDEGSAKWHVADESEPAVETGFLTRFRFTPEPPWTRVTGLAQVLLALAVTIGVSLFGTVSGFLIDLISNDSFSLRFDTSLNTNEKVIELIKQLPATLVLGAIFQQIGQGGSAFLISKIWKGYGVVRDWGLSFKKVDIAIGAGMAAVGFVLLRVISFGLSPLLGVEDMSESDNGVIVSGFEGSLWLYPVIFMVVIGAPLSEEIAFRGVLQRTLSRFGGPVVGIVVSSAAFSLVHSGGTSSGGQVILWVSIFGLGLLFATASAYFNRLGPSIVAHFFTNLGASIALLVGG